MPSSRQRHFTFSHPVFRQPETTSGKQRKDSVYYYWWEFLRRHDGYKSTCNNGGNGKYAKLYRDFGDVHDGTFKEWWTKGGRGAHLFAEPSLPTSVIDLKPEDLVTLSECWKAGAVLVVAIPLTLRKRFIVQKFNKLLAKHHKRRRGQRTLGESQALYPIRAQFTHDSLKKILDTYDRRKSGHVWWKIGQELRLGDTLTKEELKGEGATLDKRHKLTVAASKKFALALRIIDGVGRGIFPDISMRG
jgi:hypothetical protein